jgi:hypothetical protein
MFETVLSGWKGLAIVAPSPGTGRTRFDMRRFAHDEITRIDYYHRVPIGWQSEDIRQ